MPAPAQPSPILGKPGPAITHDDLEVNLVDRLVEMRKIFNQQKPLQQQQQQQQDNVGQPMGEDFLLPSVIVKPKPKPPMQVLNSNGIKSATVEHLEQLGSGALRYAKSDGMLQITFAFPPPKEQQPIGDDKKGACLTCSEYEICTVNMPCGCAMFCSKCSLGFTLENLKKCNQILCPHCRKFMSSIRPMRLVDME